MFGFQMALDRFQISVKQVLTWFGLQRCLEELARRGRCVKTLRLFPGKQTGNKLGAILREFENRFVHELDIEVAVSNVDNESHGWFQRRDICEVLLRPDSHVYASLLRCSKKLRNDILKVEFVRKEIIGTKSAVLL